MSGYSLIILFLCSLCTIGYSQPVHRTCIALTFDDPNTIAQPLLNAAERNEKILSTLKKHSVHAALFVCGKRVNSPEGKALLRRWDEEGHLICNHSITHSYFNAPNMSAQMLISEIKKCDAMISAYTHYARLFRFPFLKEGNTAIKRDSVRAFMDSAGYRNGYVTIDASDWYIDGRMIDSLKANPHYDCRPFAGFYIKHILDHVVFYDSLAAQAGLTNITHILLLHHSLLNAIYLDTLIIALKGAGYKIVSAESAYSPQNYIVHRPNVIPTGESIIWSISHEKCPKCVMRYPAEDGEYEEANLSEWLRLSQRKP